MESGVENSEELGVRSEELKKEWRVKSEEWRWGLGQWKVLSIGVLTF